MAQVTMSGREYADLMEVQRKLDELVNLFRETRKFSVPEESVRTYSTGLFKNTFKFPQWVDQYLAHDMEIQLLVMDEVEFARLVKANVPWYSPLEREFRQEPYRDEGYTNMYEKSLLIRQRWDKIKKRLDAGELIDEEEEGTKDGE